MLTKLLFFLFLLTIISLAIIFPQDNEVLLGTIFLVLPVLIIIYFKVKKYHLTHIFPFLLLNAFSSWKDGNDKVAKKYLLSAKSANQLLLFGILLLSLIYKKENDALKSEFYISMAKEQGYLKNEDISLLELTKHIELSFKEYTSTKLNDALKS